MYCCYSKRKELDVHMLLDFWFIHHLTKLQPNAVQLDLRRFQPRVRRPSASIASASTDLTSVPVVNSQNRKSVGMSVDRSVPAAQGGENRSTGLEVENANGDLVQLRIMAPRKSIFLFRAAADTPIDDVLQFIYVNVQKRPISVLKFNYKQLWELGGKVVKVAPFEIRMLQTSKRSCVPKCRFKFKGIYADAFHTVVMYLLETSVTAI
uniref:Uncharacterized protein n=1 Tax=Glossina austeni TaxID=7395 RepID=A0A1A9UIR4_GLOAU